MLKLDRRLAPAVIASLALGLAACGSHSNDNSSSTTDTTATSASTPAATESTTTAPTTGKDGGKITVLMGTAPDHLDPHQGYTTQAAEADWITYTGLLTYKHENGTAGGELIPGLAEDLPTVSKDGLTYELTMRKGLKYSDGTDVKASDFEYSVERMMRLNWGGKSFVTNYVVGAADYDAKKAKDIKGITSDDATGKITIKLSEPYGAFSNVLAFPAVGLVPSGTPMKDLSADPPPGVGAYKITNVVPNQGWTMEKVPGFADFNIPDIPTGHLDEIDVKIQSNTQSEAQQVLDNQADIFDFGDTLPPSLAAQIQSDASDRFEKETIPSIFYMFLNTTKPPFNNIKAREAVNVGVDRRGFVRLAAGFLKPECFFLPEGLPGHPGGDCPFGSKDENTAPDVAKAKQLVQESGQADTPIVVWGERRAPRTEYVNFYTSELKKIGFTNVKEKIINDETYFPTIGSDKTDPQTGFADWIQDFPNPSDFYLLMNAKAIQPTNNQNFSQVNDPHIQSELAVLNKVPTTKLQSVAKRWEELDEYTAKKAYVAVFGYESKPKFFSNRLNFGAAIFQLVYGNDWTSFELK
jgi:peptide/nickel transport system substrate-binding protein